MRPLVLVCLCFASFATPARAAQATAPTLDSLAPDARVLGFRAAALYVDDDGTAIGARFIHERSGLTFDYLRMETAAQAFLWVETLPLSEKGESHTQEHLLITKGNKGRAVGTLGQMTLSGHSAFNAQRYTCFHFDTQAGPEAFWPMLASVLEALLHPDYSDEEIHREVRNFGVADASGGQLRLEEKGAVYNEMVRTTEQPGDIVAYASRRLAFGATHPLARNQGGTPAGIRQLTADDIRRFHRAHYRLANMGMIGVFPRAVALETVLRRIGALLDGEPPRVDGKMASDADVPPATPAPEGTIDVVEFPYAQREHAGAMLFSWAPTRRLEGADRLLLAAFLDSLASDGGSTLYKKLIDRQSRVVDVGATGVWNELDPEPGHAIFIGVDDVAASRLSEAGVRAIRDIITGELAAIAALPDGSPELAAFEARVASRLAEQRREAAKLLETPPRFGARDTSDRWLNLLAASNREAGFRKPLGHGDAFAQLRALLAGPGNPWRERLRAWGLIGVTPFGVAAKASPTLRETLDRERAQRLADEEARLLAHYGVTDEQEALRRFRVDYDRASATLAQAEASATLPPFTDSPPLTLDDTLPYHEAHVGGVPLFAASFDVMKGATVTLALRLDRVPESALVFLPLLPRLVSDVGVLDGDGVIAHDRLRDRLRNEVLGLRARLDGSLRSGHAELVLEGSGSDVAETRRALGWMARLLTHPDWRVANLPRIRDVIDEKLAEYRNVMLGAEERWVTDPPSIFWRQDRPLLAHTRSFLTMAHDTQRLRWMFDGAADAAQARALARFAAVLATAGHLDRDELRRLSGALARGEETTEARLAPYLAARRRLPATLAGHARRMGQDLEQLLADAPPSSLARDWAELCRQMADDARLPPERALAALRATLRAVTHAGNARVVLVSARPVEAALAPDLEKLISVLDPKSLPPVHYAAGSLVLDRLRARDPAAAQAHFYGLVNPNTQSGVFVNSARVADYAETRPTELLDYLAANLYAGGGAHSLWARTAASGLAYSNGIGANAFIGRLRYYAERCTDLATTMRFVIDELRHARPDPRLGDYALALAFWSRVTETYEARAADLAADLSDGVTPDQVRAFRTRLIALRAQPGFAAQLFARMNAVYARVLPGLEPLTLPTADAVAFVIGPERQLAAYESYLHGLWGDEARLARLYPRDFWATVKPQRPARLLGTRPLEESISHQNRPAATTK